MKKLSDFSLQELEIISEKIRHIVAFSREDEALLGIKRNIIEKEIMRRIYETEGMEDIEGIIKNQGL